VKSSLRITIHICFIYFIKLSRSTSISTFQEILAFIIFLCTLPILINRCSFPMLLKLHTRPCLSLRVHIVRSTRVTSLSSHTSSRGSILLHRLLIRILVLWVHKVRIVEVCKVDLAYFGNQLVHLCLISLDLIKVYNLF